MLSPFLDSFNTDKSNGSYKSRQIAGRLSFACPALNLHHLPAGNMDSTTTALKKTGQLQVLVVMFWFWKNAVLKHACSLNLASSLNKTCCFICKTSRSPEQCLRFSTTMVKQKLCALGNPKMTKAAFIYLHLL